MLKDINPRIGVATHFMWDESLVEEMVAGVRAHWDGLFQFGIDIGVLNVTIDAVWYRKAVLPEMSGTVPPMREMAEKMARAGVPMPEEFPFPNPRRTREEQQEQYTRDIEIDPHEYYPPEVYREPMTEWPMGFSIDLEKMIGQSDGE